MVLFYVLKLVLPLVLDDWLRRERFVFEWSNSFLFSGTAFGVWFGSIFISSWFYLEGCNALVKAISTPPNNLGYFILSWEPEAAGISGSIAVSFGVTGNCYLILILLGLAFLGAIHGATVNTLVEDIDGANTFNSTQAEDTSLTANRFWPLIFGIAFMFSHHLWIGGADDSSNQIYALDSCMSGELLELTASTLGTAFNTETSSVGVVLDFSCRNTNLNKPIPMSGGFGQSINTSGAD
jgi:hypothetical protein